MALLSGAVLINYLDRAILGIAAPTLSAFSWSYFAAQIPFVIALDRFGARIIYALALASWSLFTLGHALATGFTSLIGFRLGLGIAEAPCFLANNSIVSRCFPRSERARAISVYTAAEYVGLGFLSPVLSWILGSFGEPECRR